MLSGPIWVKSMLVRQNHLRKAPLLSLPAMVLRKRDLYLLLPPLEVLDN